MPPSSTYLMRCSEPEDVLTYDCCNKVRKLGAANGEEFAAAVLPSAILQARDKCLVHTYRNMKFRY